MKRLVSMSKPRHRYSCTGMPSRLIPAVLVLCCLVLGSVNAQSRYISSLHGYNVRSWSTTEGLPNNKIFAILQSRSGYIWLGTQEGLVRFDGESFTTFDSKNTPVLPHNEITMLFEDKDSTLWISTVRGMVTIPQRPVLCGSRRFRCRSVLLQIISDGSEGQVPCRNTCGNAAGRRWQHITGTGQ